MEKHVAECPLQAVPCSFADIGCLHIVSILMVSKRVKNTNKGISGIRGQKGVKQNRGLKIVSMKIEDVSSVIEIWVYSTGMTFFQ